ncbi:MAG: hypothetical protein MI919_39050, partial [Holophagales bacterium]|nr:hypothetical protein [Holophagales bacterium]
MADDPTASSGSPKNDGPKARERFLAWLDRRKVIPWAAAALGIVGGGYLLAGAIGYGVPLPPPLWLEISAMASFLLALGGAFGLGRRSGVSGSGLASGSYTRPEERWRLDRFHLLWILLL